MSNLKLNDVDIDVLIIMIYFGQIEISRQMKRLTSADFDLKEFYWFYRSRSNELKKALHQIRGY